MKDLERNIAEICDLYRGELRVQKIMEAISRHCVPIK